MPNAATAFRLVDSAAKCAPTAASPSAPAIQAARAAAFIAVSWVVKDFDATSTSVRAGSRSCTASANACPSTLDRKRACMRASVRPMVSASVATRGPEVGAADADIHHRGEALPGGAALAARHAPRRRNRACGRVRRRRVRGVVDRRRPSAARRPASAGARSAMCIAARCSVTFTAAPANRRRRNPSRSAASASANSASQHRRRRSRSWRSRASDRRASR